MHQNTVKNRYSEQSSSENFIVFNQVRIPLFDEKGRAIDTRAFVRGLQKYLKDSYNITSKVDQRGLGHAALIIGDK